MSLTSAHEHLWAPPGGLSELEALAYRSNLLASDQDAAYRNALKAAVAEARTKAETLATASNSTLGKITAIVEGGGSMPMPMAVGAAKDSSVPIEPGTQKIEATVSVTFALG